MAEMLELSDQKFKITAIYMPRALTGKVDNMQEQTGSVSREPETLRKDSKGNARNKKNLVVEMKKAFSGLFSRLDLAEERISESEDTSKHSFNCFLFCISCL